MHLTFPDVPRYGRQIFICTNGNCASPEQVAQVIQQFEEINRQHGYQRRSNPARITLVPCGCLGVCIGGPILVVYPDGIWYGNVDAERLERIYTEHFLQGEPVAEYLLHRYFPAGTEPSPQFVAVTLDPLEVAAEKAAAEKERNQQAQKLADLPEHVRAARERQQQRRRRSSQPGELEFTDDANTAEERSGNVE